MCILAGGWGGVVGKGREMEGVEEDSQGLDLGAWMGADRAAGGGAGNVVTQDTVHVWGLGTPRWR